jgi:hypothetical protein
MAWQRATRSLWSATLFRDIQTAVDSGNGALRKKFRGVERKFFEFFAGLVQAGLP